MKTNTARRGACVSPPAPRTLPGLIVRNSNFPAVSVKILANPVNFAGLWLVLLPFFSLCWPSASACQISNCASGTGCRSPSRICPRIVITAPEIPGTTRSLRFKYSRPMLKNGPTVWEALIEFSLFHWRLLTPTQHDIEPVAQRVTRLRRLPIEFRNQPAPCALIRPAVIDRVKFQQRIAGKVHLSDQSRQQARTKQRKMNMLRPPRVVMITPWVSAWLNRNKSIASFGVGHYPATSGKIRIEWRSVVIHFMQITSGCVGLPDLHQRLRHAPSILIQHSSANDDSFSQRLARTLCRQIAVRGRHQRMAKNRPASFSFGMRKQNQWFSRGPLDRRNVSGMEVFRLGAGCKFSITPWVVHRESE